MTRPDICPHCCRRLPAPRDGFWRALEAQSFLLLEWAIPLLLFAILALEVAGGR